MTASLVRRAIRAVSTTSIVAAVLIAMVGCGAGQGTATLLTRGPATTAPPGDRVLYTCLALGDRVVAYRLGTDGLLPAAPFSEIEIHNPHRLVLENGVLHVGTDDRVASLVLGADGSLPTVPTASTRPVTGADVLALKVRNGVLYAAMAGLLRVRAFQLEPPGIVSLDPLSSSGTTITDYQTITIGDGFLYAAARASERIDIFLINADGSLPTDPELQIPSTTVRFPEDIVYSNGILYAIEQTEDRINSYHVFPNGLLPVDPDSMTDRQKRYARLAIDGDRLYASAFNQGRIDYYELDPNDGSLPPGPSFMTQFDTGSFPSAMLVNDGILYVAQTGLDRIDAYVIGSDGSPTFFPTSSTDVIADGFPSDIAIGTFPPS